MSIFLDEKVLENAARTLNNIVITDGKQTVTGMLQENLQFSVEADWDNIFSLNERFAATKTILGTAGLGLFNAGMWTKKFYKGGSYLKINPKIRVLDGNANGTVLDAAEALIDFCLPVYNGALDLKTKELLQKSIAKVKKDGVLKSAGDAVVAGLKAGFNELGDILNGEESQKLLNLLSGKEILSNSPTPVLVKISNFYSNSFIVESVQVEFSKEMTDYGPLYVDINMSLSAPMVTTRGNSGIHGIGNKPRFIRAN